MHKIKCHGDKCQNVNMAILQQDTIHYDEVIDGDVLNKRNNFIGQFECSLCDVKFSNMRALNMRKYTCHGDTTEVDIVDNQRYTVTDDKVMIEGMLRTNYDNNHKKDYSHCEESNNSKRLKQLCEYCNKIFVNCNEHHNECNKNPANNYTNAVISSCSSLADAINTDHYMMSSDFMLCGEKTENLRQGRSIGKLLVRDSSNASESSITSSDSNFWKVKSKRTKSKQLCDFCSKYFVNICIYHNYCRKNLANSFSVGFNSRSLLAILPCTTNRQLMTIDCDVSMCSDRRDVRRGRSINRRSRRKRLMTKRSTGHSSSTACSSASGNNRIERMKRRRYDVSCSHASLKNNEQLLPSVGWNGHIDSEDDVTNEDNISNEHRINGKHLDYYEMITKKDIDILKKMGTCKDYNASYEITCLLHRRSRSLIK